MSEPYLSAATVDLARACLGRRVLYVELHRDADDQAWFVLQFVDGATVQIALADGCDPIITEQPATSLPLVH